MHPPRLSPRVLTTLSRRSSTTLPIRHYASSTPIPPTTKPIIFSGIQPTGTPHLGNYFGALRNWTDLQRSASPSTTLIFSIVDLHAITIPQPPGALLTARTDMLKSLLALGIDPERSVLFEQGAVSAHAELMWILSTVVRVGWLTRMTQWKAKTGQTEGTGNGDGLERLGETKGAGRERERAGLLCYPVLQAADILVHRATEVPVGEDQIQHLEFTREVARAFNHAYNCNVFPEPKTVLGEAKRVMSLRNPTAKMSKSDPEPGSRILLTDSPDMIAAKFKKAVTDSRGEVTYEPKERPGVANLVEILGHCERRGDFGVLAEELAREGGGMRKLKERVTEAVVEELRGFREEWGRVEAEGEGVVEAVRRKGGDRARESAEATLKLVKDAVGLA